MESCSNQKSVKQIQILLPWGFMLHHVRYSSLFVVDSSENLLPWGFMLANNLVFKKVHWAIGLDRCRNCLTGAAPITRETLEYFMSLRLPLYELYGMSESTGPHTISWENNFKIMSCGKVVNGCQTKLDKPDKDGNGEICFWGCHVFMGYLKKPEKTEEALDQEGWLHSGDLGKHNKDNFLFITGRIKELIITAGGENIPPVPIEDAVKAETAIISNAMLLGDKLKFLSMMLTLKVRPQTLDVDCITLAFCQQRGVVATKASEITASKEPRIQKWVILDRDFSISGGELGESVNVRNIYSTSQKFGQTHSFKDFSLFGLFSTL
uniref:long-chain-fatty-acid--CoA ligase n=1 Tax=Hucho hucho TaxID=62062 RepID=A0A4W5MXR9_9TELE